MSFNKIKEVQYHRLYESVIKQLEEIIFEGDLEPGSALPTERKLAADLGVSRSTLRESFRILEREGLITTRPGGGRFITQDLDRLKSRNEISNNIETATIRDLIAAREVFEVGIVELAAKLATKEDIEEIEKSLNAWGEIKSDEPEAFLSPDQSFHLSIAKATKNYVLVSLMDYQMELLRKTREKIGKTYTRKKEIHEEHLLIYQAIKENNPKLARESLLYHLDQIKSNLNND